MSSLLQFTGSITRKGVGLQFVDDSKVHVCTICGELHPRVHIAYRKPAGMWGHWVCFRYFGEVHVPDLSIPITTQGRMPRGAVPLDDEASSSEWHRP